LLFQDSDAFLERAGGFGVLLFELLQLLL